LLVAVFVLFAANRGRADDPFLLIFTPVMTLGYATVGTVIASRSPNNAIGWLLISVGLGWALASLCDAYAVHGLEVAPGSLPAAAYAPLLNNVAVIMSFGPIPFLVLLFPTGRPPSRRWRMVGWSLLATLSLGLFGLTFAPGEVGGSAKVQNPIGIEAVRPIVPALLTIGGLGTIALAIVCVVGLILRFRRSRGEERQQLRWLAYALAAAAAFIVAVLVSNAIVQTPANGTDPLFVAAFAMAFFLIMAIGLPVAIGIAILRYRLYDIDVVINKTVVYGALAAFITLVYVGMVVGIGTAIGQGDRPNLGLSILATAVVAVAFQPVRERVQRFANRVVYGKRATPYEVLAHFSERMASTYAADELLPQMARILAEGTGAERAEVWLVVGKELRPGGSWPEGDSLTGARGGIALENRVAVPGVDLSLPVEDRGETLGAIGIAKARGEPVTDGDRKLLQDLAAQAGLVLRNVKLIEELRASRQRLVAAQDQERRRLERNIHDGAQQQLVALSVKLGLAKMLARKDVQKTDEVLAQLQAETTDALENLRDLARGIYPPLLADQGLSAALQAQARKASLPVTVEADGVGRYSQDAEAAVYFSALEALQNVAKYASASHATVRLFNADGALTFEVQDDGRGFDPETTSYGTGLQGIKDRLEALGGSMTIASRPGEGTSMRGSLPAAPALSRDREAQLVG
jgi:signal transduction histidine kinase